MPVDHAGPPQRLVARPLCGCSSMGGEIGIFHTLRRMGRDGSRSDLLRDSHPRGAVGRCRHRHRGERMASPQLVAMPRGSPPPVAKINAGNSRGSTRLAVELHQKNQVRTLVRVSVARWQCSDQPSHQPSTRAPASSGARMARPSQKAHPAHENEGRQYTAAGGAPGSRCRPSGDRVPISPLSRLTPAVPTSRLRSSSPQPQRAGLRGGRRRGQTPLGIVRQRNAA